MRQIFSSKRLRGALTTAAVLGCALALVCWPQEVSAAVREALALCGNVIVPSLFPFFILSSLVVSLGLAGALGRLLEPVMAPLFRVNGSCAAVLALGFVGGYPVGARSALALYQSGQCSRVECERLLAFCNNSGPAFILGVVGAGVFADSRVGLLLWLIHALASVCVGLVFRSYRARSGGGSAPAVLRPITAQRLPTAFVGAVRDSVGSTLNICAFVICFNVILRLCFLSGVLPVLARVLGTALSPLGVSETGARQLLSGALELTAGVTALSSGGPLSARVSMAAFLLGWAGVSVHCQVLSFLADSGLNARTYLVGKLLHGCFSAALTALALRVFPLEQSVPAFLAQQVDGIAAIDFSSALTVSIAVAWGIFLLFFLVAALGAKKQWKKRRRYAIMGKSQK